MNFTFRLYSPLLGLRSIHFPRSALPLTRLTPLTRDRTISWHRSTIKLPKWHYTSIELPNRRMHWADSAWDTQGVRMPGHCGGHKDTVSSFSMWILAHYLFDLQGVNMVGVSSSHHMRLGFSSSRFWKIRPNWNSWVKIIFVPRNIFQCILCEFYDLRLYH